MEKLKEKITVPNIIMLFIILQPIIDIVTGLSMEYANATITVGIIIRTVFMMVVAIWGFIKADKKYKVVLATYYSILAMYMLGFLINCYMKNSTSLIFLQIKGLIKNFYLPIVIVALIPIFKAHNINIDKKVLKISLMIYVVTICICSIVGCAFPTYKTGDKAGTVGLFYSGNEIGAILCILSPFLLIDLSRRKVKLLDCVLLALLIYAILQVGTKVPYFGLIILFAVFIITCIVKKLYIKAGAFFAVLIVVYLLTGLTPVGDNLTKIYGDVFVITRDIFGENTTPPQVTEFEDFSSFTNATVSQRDDLLKANKTIYKNGSTYDKIIGIGFVDNTDGKMEELKLVEMDYYDIIFCSGILGTILFVIPILAFGIVLILMTVSDRKLISTEPIYSIAMAMVVALLAGHVLISPAVCIYIAIIMLMYYRGVFK